METRKDLAIRSFTEGLNCAQSVLSAYTDTYEIDKSMALSLSCAFGGGMGRLQETCGAVTGAFMVISVYNCRKYSANSERKEMTYAMVQNFHRQFVHRNGTSNCRALLNCDLNTKEGQEYAKQNNVFKEVCEKCISDSLEILEKLVS